MSPKFPPKPKSLPLIGGVIVAAATSCGGPTDQQYPPQPPPQPMDGEDPNEAYAEPPADAGQPLPVAPQVAPMEEDPPPQVAPKNDSEP